MVMKNVPGMPLVQLGVDIHSIRTALATTTNTMDAADEATIYIGQVFTSDGASHTIDTTGSSSLQWRTSTVTFANGGTTVVVGLAAVDTGAGPPGRASNTTNVINFDVSKSLTGGGGGVTTDAWQTHVPDTGTKTIANGDFVAFAVQMTARGGADSVRAAIQSASSSVHRPTVTGYIGGSYTALSGVPNCIIVFSDGALGYFYGGSVFSTINTRTWNTGGAVDEYGQLYNFPFPMKIHGIYGHIDSDADCNIVLYSDPLGTPVAEKTVSIDANAVSGTTGRMFQVLFSSPYTYAPNTNIGAVFSPGASNVSAYYRTLANADHRVADVWGTSGYGIQRAATGVGAFADSNSSLDHYYIGLLVGAFEHGVQPTYVLGI